jgi:hypothetical protein
MFTGFHSYDDEGYFLIVLRGYLGGESLLNPTAPAYGPFFFEVVGGVFKLLGIQPTHDAGRWITVVMWLIASLIAGLGAHRLLRSVWLAVGVQLATFAALAALGNEPMQPSVLTSLLLVCLVGVASFRSARPRLTAVAVGAIVAAMCLVKLNVGGFAGIAVVFAWSCSLPGRWRRVLAPLMVVVLAAVPLLLTAAVLNRDWVLELGILVALSSAAVGVACLVARPAVLPPPSAVWMIGGGVFVAAISLGVAMAGGTTPADVWNGLVLFSLRVPQLFVVPLRISPLYDAWAVAALLGAIALARWPLAGNTAALARVAVGFFMWLVLLLPPNTLFLLALPMAWLATRPPAEDATDPTDPYARFLLPALAVLETLQTFPAAGTELSLAELAVIPVGALIVNDGVRGLRLAPRPGFASWVPPAAVAFNVLTLLLFAVTAVAGYQTDAPLGLPGASSVRVPEQQSRDLRALVDAIDRQCSSLITLPGMNSLYVWSGQDPPAQLRSEVWWLTLDGGEQASIVQRLQDRPRLCVVRNQSVVDFWALGRQVPDRPLVQFIDQDFTSGGTFGDYELLIRNSPD